MTPLLNFVRACSYKACKLNVINEQNHFPFHIGT